MEPTIGRIVIYSGNGQDRPAIITAVWSPVCVNLHVFSVNSWEPDQKIDSVFQAGAPGMLGWSWPVRS